MINDVDLLSSQEESLKIQTSANLILLQMVQVVSVSSVGVWLRVLNVYHFHKFMVIITWPGPGPL